MGKDDKLVGFISIFIGVLFSVLFTIAPNFRIIFRTYQNVIVLIFWFATAYIPSSILVGSGVWMIVGEIERKLWLEIVLVSYSAIMFFLLNSIVISYTPITLLIN